MNDLLAFFLGVILGFFIQYKKTPQLPALDILSNQVQELEKQLAYYKDLCKWHVEEKRKLQELKDKFESECG